ncbi:protein FAM196A-like [Scleropages formosus]|uniref:Protein FAM196A-like n=1 Tax=Scleropages formosus TaxID=113540 RepID=A0A0P7U7N9_SCLFO|nr:protein FAM196A-like [Scleropages formosus]
MVSREASKCVVTNSESDSEAAPSLALEMKYSLDHGRQVRKRNKALQVRFKDICEAQNEQREAARQAAGKGGRPAPSKVVYRKYMTVPARRSIPNVTRSTGVQTSPDLRKRYQTFPFERKKGHSLKHAAAADSVKGQGNGIEANTRRPREVGGLDDEAIRPLGNGTYRTRVLLHTNDCTAALEPLPGVDCSDGPVCADPLLSCSKDTQGSLGDRIGGTEDAPQKGLQPREGVGEARPSAKRQLSSFEEAPAGPPRDSGPRVTGPIAWNSLTQVECLESPSARSKRKKGAQLNGLQVGAETRAQTLSHSGCPAAPARCHATSFAEPTPVCSTDSTSMAAPCQQIVPVAQDGDLKAQLQVMENLISSSQETIKVLLGVIQELEKGEAHREGQLAYFSPLIPSF